MKRRDALVFGAAAVLAGVMPHRRALAQADKYPERPIRLIIPFTTGGVNDAVGRPWADKMKSLLGTVVVENIGGAGGSLGAQQVARAQPDGYTILLAGMGSQVINPVASRPLYDPIKDFEPIAMLGLTGLTIAVHPSLPVRNLTELIAYAKANPGKMSFGSSGVGAMTHLTGELFKSLAGLPDIVHIPYRGGGPLIQDLVGGQIQMIAQSVTGHMIELHESGKVRMLCVTSPKRLAAAPNLPTAVEAGLPGMIAQNFIGLMAPARTLKPIIDRLAEATRAAMADKQFAQAFVASGFEPNLDPSPAGMRKMLEEETARWTPIIKSIGLTLDK